MKQSPTNHLAPDDKASVQDTLWLYYHHAISSAINHGDEGAARSFSKKALSYLSPDNPNKITRLFYYLTHEKYDEAQKWAEGIDDYQQETAIKILNIYLPKINKKRQQEQPDQIELERLEQEIQNA